jgi:hypothetical protein
MTEVFNVICKDYPVELRLSEKQRPKYIKEGNRIGKRQEQALKAGMMKWVEGKLFDNVTNGFVVKNPSQVGTPRLVPISGQYFWQGGSRVEWYRQRLKEQLAAYFIPRIKMQLPIQKLFPPKNHFIHFEFIFYTRLQVEGRKIPQDVDNHAYPYMKVFVDTVKTLGMIEDDLPQIYRGSEFRYVEIEDIAERRLEIKIHFCRNGQAIMYDISKRPDSKTY